MCKGRGSETPDLSKKNFMEVLAKQSDWNERDKYQRLRSARVYGNKRITNELLKQFYDRAKAEHDAILAKDWAEHKKKEAKMQKVFNEQRKKQEAKDDGADLRYTPFKEQSLNSAFDTAAGKTECSESHAI